MNAQTYKLICFVIRYFKKNGVGIRLVPGPSLPLRIPVVTTARFELRSPWIRRVVPCNVLYTTKSKNLCVNSSQRSTTCIHQHAKVLNTYRTSSSLSVPKTTSTTCRRGVPRCKGCLCGIQAQAWSGVKIYAYFGER